MTLIKTIARIVYIIKVVDNELDFNFKAVPLEFFKVGIIPNLNLKELSSSKMR
jgi:hypothetical protein